MPPLRRYGGFPITHFFRLEGAEKIRNKRFKIGVFKAAFTVRNVQDAPEGKDLLLEALIDYFIAEADRYSGLRAEKCSIIIRNSVLERPIQIPYRSLAQNSAQVVMQQFDDVDQSGQRMGRPSLYTQPIHIEIVIGPSTEEAMELVRQARGGTGRRRREIVYGVDQNNLIETSSKGPLARSHCLLLAVVLSICYKGLERGNQLENNRFQQLVRSDGRTAVRRRNAMILEFMLMMRRAGIKYPMGERRYTVDKHVPMIQRYFDNMHPRVFRLSVFGSSGRMRPLWKGKQRARHELCLYLRDGHYYGVRKLDALFGAKYCMDCESTYFDQRNHRAKCVAKCARCCGMGFGFPCRVEAGYYQECDSCHNVFRSARCYQRHLEKRICELFKRCLLCGQIYRVKRGAQLALQQQQQQLATIDDDDDSSNDEQRQQQQQPNADDGHRCFVHYCNMCRSLHQREEPCFVQPIQPKRNRPYLMIIYDFESAQISPTQDPEEWQLLDLPVAGWPADDENYRIHQVNCVSAMLLCSVCMGEERRWANDLTGDCRHCGPNRHRMHTWTAATCDDPLREFLNWLIHGLGSGRNRRIRTYAMAHFGGRYDMHLLLGEILKMGGMEPKIIRSGNKLFELKLKRKPGIHSYLSFRDTFNWMSLKLEQLPKALGLRIDEGGKAFFPHGWNQNRNMAVRLPGLPDRQHYYPDSMSAARLAQFDEWYAANRQRPFRLRDEIGGYCEQDVRILAHAVIKFRQLFFELATAPEKRDDCFVNSLTMAGSCIRHFCINYLKPKQIAITPDNGYHHDSNQSVIGLKFLKWLAHSTGMPIQHRDSAAGERRLRLRDGQMIRLDGFVERQPAERDIAIEFLGCSWHGHECYYKPYEICLNGKTAMYNRDLLEERKRKIREAGLELMLFWECDVLAQLEADEEMAAFFASLLDTGPIFPRDGFQGGRTGPTVLKCDLEELGIQGDYEISDYDVVSLYPSVNFDAAYPIGHPELIDVNRAVEFSAPEHLRPHRGLFKIFLVPPEQLYLPVIPERIHDKLIFHLCHRCTLEAPAGEAIRLEEPYSQQLGRTMCTHDDHERGFICTVSSVELELALSRGYRVTWLYSVYHWAEWSEQLLRPYVQDMMRLKIQASGWPDYIMAAAGDPVEQRRLKDDYIRQNQEAYGIVLDEARVELNEGLRHLSKGAANAHWGRWSLRCNLTKDLITSCPVELHTILNDPRLELGAVELLAAPDLFAVPYQHKREFVRPHDKYNIVIALITTANARVRLYHYMERIHQQRDSVLLYTDTDSCIYAHRRGQAPPFTEGKLLGQMSREHKDYEIRAFYCGGCKQYAMKLQHRQTGEIRYIVKCRGCWERADSPLDFNQFKKMVNAYGQDTEEPVLLERTHLQPDWQHGQVVTKSQKRRYAPISDKGMVDARLICYPYGYRGPAIRSGFLN